MKKVTRIGIGGPVGSGKTAIVEAITPRLLDLGVKVLIITNDVVTTEDAKHVQRTLKGVLLEERILGVETGACPHTAVREDPSMNLAAVEDMEARFPDGDVVLIESGGDNLTLTFSPALVDFFIYVIDVAAGDKIPRKNGPGISQSDILVINKTDLAPYVGASLEVMDHDFAVDARREAVLVHQLQDRRGYPGAGRSDSQRPPVRPETRRTRRRVMGACEDEPPWPEFARNFGDEPAQMRSGAVGKRGLLSLGFEKRGDRTILAHLTRRTPCLVSRALYCDSAMPDMPWLFTITSTGCVLQGDRLHMDVSLKAGARAHVTTQSATKVHTMDANYGVMTQLLTLDENSYLEFLPDPLLLHRGARFASRTRIRIPSSATLLYSEIVQPGRKHHEASESLAVTLLALEMNAERPDGELLMRERLVLDPKEIAPRQTGVMDCIRCLRQRAAADA